MEQRNGWKTCYKSQANLWRQSILDHLCLFHRLRPVFKGSIHYVTNDAADFFLIFCFFFCLFYCCNILYCCYHCLSFWNDWLYRPNWWPDNWAPNVLKHLLFIPLCGVDIYNRYQFFLRIVFIAYNKSLIKSNSDAPIWALKNYINNNSNSGGTDRKTMFFPHMISSFQHFMTHFDFGL